MLKYIFLFRCESTEMLFHHYGASLTVKVFINGLHNLPQDIMLGQNVSTINDPKSIWDIPVYFYKNAVIQNDMHICIMYICISFGKFHCKYSF